MIILPPNPRILLVRTDKIGDVVLTTPALASLKRRYPSASIFFLARAYAAPLLQNHPALDRVLTIDGKLLTDLALEIRALRFDAAVHFYLDGRAEAATWLGRVPVRVGPFSKITALFLSHRVVQRRSRVEKHEAEYNLDLARACGAGGDPEPPHIRLTESERRRGRDILAKLGAGRPVVLHPGSAGSAASWPLENFVALAKLLAAQQQKVVFTAGKGEEKIWKAAQSLSGPNIQGVPPGSLSLRELAAVISASKALIANSTGPLHMAVALGVPTLSFFPKLPAVTSSRRWGPFGNMEKNLVLSPAQAQSPLSSIDAREALRAARKLF